MDRHQRGSMAPDQNPDGAPPWLDHERGHLWRGREVVRLRPKSFAVLCYLVAHPARVISKDELVQAVWPDTAVSDGVLTVCIAELRKALGDTAQTPQYLETVPRRGYRWLGVLATHDPLAVQPMPEAPPPPVLPSQPVMAAVPVRAGAVGRAAECAQLHAWLAQAQNGVRQLGFIAGPAGMGKTTVVDTFVAQLAHRPEVWLARGQCMEHYGAGEAYLPVFEALGQLGRSPDGALLVEGLMQHAPTWLVQMPALLDPTTRDALQRRALGATPERMLRELVEAVEALTAERLLVLVLEDLHWSDSATLDLVGYLARRRGPARVLVLGTYRPMDAVMRAHPLQTLVLDLQLHGQCTTLTLNALTTSHVTEYLAARLGAGQFPAALAPALFRRTDGHPLFLVTVVDALLRQGVLQEVEGRWTLTQDLDVVEQEVPESLRHLIIQQFLTLSTESRQLVEAASVAGLTATVAEVAAALDADLEAVESQCAVLGRTGQFFLPDGLEVWPDGTRIERYCFRHPLYQQVLYEQISPTRCRRLHQRIGLRQETGYGARVGERAAVLAMHFERGHDLERAIHYRQQAAEQALRRYAYREAIVHLSTALELLQRLPEMATQQRQEVHLQMALGRAMMATRGYGVPDVERIYTRALTLCQQLGDTTNHVAILEALCRFAINRATLRMARQRGEELLTMAQRSAHVPGLLSAHQALGQTLYYLGEFPAARLHLEQDTAALSANEQQVSAVGSDVEVRVYGLAFAAQTLWLLGYATQARQRCQEACALAQTLAQPQSLTIAFYYSARLAMSMQDVSLAQQHAEEAMRLATEHGFALWHATSLFIRGWALARHGQVETGLEQMLQGIAGTQQAGTVLPLPLYCTLCAEVYGQVGQIEDGLKMLAQAAAIATQNDMAYYAAEVARVQGELLLRQNATDVVQAEACFQQALAIAQRQQARLLELRAAMSLGRLWQQQGKQTAAQALLAPLANWFTEGFDTADVHAATMLLAACSTP